MKMKGGDPHLLRVPTPPEGTLGQEVKKNKRTGEVGRLL